MRNPQRKVIGVVQLVNKKGGPFTRRDERLLAAMAAQAAISIENTRLYAQEIQQQLTNQELETARTIQRSFLPETIPLGILTVIFSERPLCWKLTVLLVPVAISLSVKGSSYTRSDPLIGACCL